MKITLNLWTILCFVLSSRGYSYMKAVDILKKICERDLYSQNRGFGVICPSREHVVPKKYLDHSIVNDLYNIFVCNSRVNSIRNCLPYKELSIGILLDGRNGQLMEDFHDNHTCIYIPSIGFTPPPWAKGVVARTCLYMQTKYPHLKLEKVLDPDLALHWSSLYPIQDWEVQRLQHIHKRKK